MASNIEIINYMKGKTNCRGQDRTGQDRTGIVI